MKEDVLEQLVDEYLQIRGYFTLHNLKFRPDPKHKDYVKNKDSNHSDIDVIGINPLRQGADRVWVVSCKSWQSGFKVKSKLEEIRLNKRVSGREAWQGFRELVSDKWSKAFLKCIESHTGQKDFTYVTAVTFIHGDKKLWENNKSFKKSLQGSPIKLLELNEILEEIKLKTTITPAATTIGRVIQLMNAADKGKQRLISELQKQEP